MLYQEYDESTLKRLQAVELEILSDFDRLCRKHEIDYFIAGGTAIGAVRHQGFIPWDDDIDVGLTRENYDKFLTIAEREYSHKYAIVNAETTPGYPLMTTRWVLKGSRFKEECFKDLDIELGIFLDLYCFDHVPDKEAKMKRQGRQAWLLSKFMILRSIKKPVLYFGGIKAKFVYSACAVIHYMMVLFQISPEFLYRKAKKVTTRYQHVPCSRIAYMFSVKPCNCVYDKSWILPTKTMEFSGLQVKAPAKVEDCLAKRYGDYMTLPPAEKRHNHPPYELVFPDENNHS